MFNFINGLRWEYFNYWIILTAVVLIFGGGFAMRLRLQQIPSRARCFDLPFLAGFLVFALGLLLFADFLLELVDIQISSPVRQLVERLLQGPRL